MPTLKAKIGGAWVPISSAGADEVYVGTTAPTDPNIELWYDSDEPNPLTTIPIPSTTVPLNDTTTGNIGTASSYARSDHQHPNAWNTAWGVVGFANGPNPVSCPVNTLTYLTATIPYTTLTTRRYRFSWAFRAVGRTDNSDTYVNTNLVLYDNTTSLQSWIDHWYQFRSQWNSFNGFVLASGDGASRAFRLGIGGASSPNTALTIYPTWFALEDVGPVTRT